MKQMSILFLKKFDFIFFFYTYFLYKKKKGGFFTENKRKKASPMAKAMKVVRARVKDEGIKSDVQGSYTGVPEDKNEKPIQDADDL